MNTSPAQNRKGSFLTQLFALRRRNQNTHVEPHIHDPAADAPPPPPPPPKDYRRASASTPRQPFLGEEYISEKPLLFDVDLDILARPSQPASRPSQPASRPSQPASRPSQPASRPSQPASRPIPIVQKLPPRVPVKAYSPPTIPLTPEEKARRRLAAQRQSQQEKEAMLREEYERQETKRRERVEQERLEREEEEARKAVLQEELRAAALRKARLEREEREIEERRSQELRERKQLEKERRLQYTKEMERWRAEQMQRAESQCSEKEEERRRSAEGRRVRIARMNEEVFSTGRTDKMVGWVTVQPPDTLAWKRRYYTFELGHAESKMLLYGNPREVVQPLDALPLDGRVDSIAEWYEGFEELEAIPHSFALRFIDGVEWRMFADSAEEKDRLLVLLSEAAGIIL
ncbi:hypothetical protein P692DRAFT_201785114 [Suillus brevipes Sb2]|nr:hypothetical protein P692DRAFT_201785114 [Suillus brevipes Sb2]